VAEVAAAAVVGRVARSSSGAFGRLMLSLRRLWGATRYAAPGGTPSATCPQVAPCDITTAIQGASPADVHAGDVVSVGAGGYVLNGQLAGSVALTIEGAPGPFPVLTQINAVYPTLSTTSGSNVSRLKLTITITRTAPGLRRGHSCLAPTAKLRHKHAKHCTRTITVGTLTRSREPAGPDKVPFSGRIGNRALSPRSYNAILRASNAAGPSKPVRLSFTIVR
jgi:hypothetical protein